MKLAFSIVYLIGLIAIMCWIIVGWTRFEEKHKVPEIVRNILGFILFVGVLFGGFWLMNSYEHYIIDSHETSQNSD